MNHDAPRQKKDGTWGYTSANDGLCHAIGYCSPFEEWSENSIANIFGADKDRYEAYIAPYRAAADKFHDGGHNSAHEACECYKQYLLDFDLRFHEEQEKPDTLYKCEAPECESFTSGNVSVVGTCMSRWNLCENHRTKEIVAGLLTVGESWHS